MIVGEGAGHGLWKRIEGERERWVGIRQEENTLRESLRKAARDSVLRPLLKEENGFVGSRMRAYQVF